MKNSILPLIAALVAASCAQAHAQIIAQWTFETTPPASAGPYAADSGTGQALGNHAGSSTYSSPAGNASAHSFSSTNWSVNDYYQFKVSTTGFDNIQLSFDQTSSNTGPRDFALDYSTDGTNFIQYGTYSVLANGTPNVPWSTTGLRNSAYTQTLDLSSIDELSNAANVYFRVVDIDSTSANGGTTASGGTDRVDNFTVTGTALVAPEPSTWALSGVALAALAHGLRRRNAALRA